MKYGSFWGNDDFKLMKNLNITLGLRVDIQGGLSEQYGRFSTFDPSAMNPVGHAGATIYHSSKANGETTWNVGPRIGFAYSLNPKTVIRGGYGMYYAGVQADSWDPYPVDGYQTNPSGAQLDQRVCNRRRFTSTEPESRDCHRLHNHEDGFRFRNLSLRLPEYCAAFRRKLNARCRERWQSRWSRSQNLYDAEVPELVGIVPAPAGPKYGDRPRVRG